MSKEISIDDFLKVEICVGSVLSAELNHKAIKPAYVLQIDFGIGGVKTTSAQLTDSYQTDDLVGKQVAAVMNFPIKRIAGIKSEVLVLAAVEADGRTILLQPGQEVLNGCRII